MERLKDLAKYDLCEEFADCFLIPVEYVWVEFVDPNFASYEEVKRTLERY